VKNPLLVEQRVCGSSAIYNLEKRAEVKLISNLFMFDKPINVLQNYWTYLNNTIFLVSIKSPTDGVLKYTPLAPGLTS
jgi:hypothetical protein